jgi:small subunit ribosomal protein S6
LETVTKKLYEAMFLVDSALAAQDWDAILDTIKSILERDEAEIVSLQKWAERKLAYPIDHKTRGTYILCYFRADGSRIRNIERTVQLSEHIMRVLILNAEGRPLEKIEKENVAVQVKAGDAIEAKEQKDTIERTVQKEAAAAQETAEEQIDKPATDD